MSLLQIRNKSKQTFDYFVSSLNFKMTTTFKCSKRELLLPYIEGGKKLEALTTVLKENYNVSEDNICFIISDIQRNLISIFNRRWAGASRNKESFLKKNSNWLDSEYLVSLPNSDEVTPDLSPSTSSGKRGRPCVSYGDSSESTKKRKNTALLSEYGFEHIYNAFVRGLRAIGEGIEANLVEKIRLADSDIKSLYFNLLDNASQITMLTDQEALSVFIDLDLTKAQYTSLRNLTNERNCSIFPPYYKIQEAKQRCYPPSSAIEITNTHAKILNLQDLLDHTAASILAINSVYKTGLTHLVLFSKWGCDGSSGQSQYKQKLPEESELISDANLFITSLVPIKLINELTGDIVWQNPVPSSVRFCRPISIEFCKETPEKTKAVVDEIKNQIISLDPSLINKEGE